VLLSRESGVAGLLRFPETVHSIELILERGSVDLLCRGPASLLRDRMRHNARLCFSHQEVEFTCCSLITVLAGRECAGVAPFFVCAIDRTELYLHSAVTCVMPLKVSVSNKSPRMLGCAALIQFLDGAAAASGCRGGSAMNPCHGWTIMTLPMRTKHGSARICTWNEQVIGRTIHVAQPRSRH